MYQSSFAKTVTFPIRFLLFAAFVAVCAVSAAVLTFLLWIPAVRRIYDAEVKRGTVRRVSSGIMKRLDVEDIGRRLGWRAEARDDGDTQG